MKFQLLHKTSHALRSVLILSCCFLLLLTGCGNNEELDVYKANMNQFFENIKVFDASINAIDPQSETAVSELLTVLDSMDNSFAQMASLEVPEGFPGVDQLADEASEYMSEAVSYYHQAFEGEEYDATLADVAKQNYDRANLRIQYIVSILHGDIPEEIYTYEDANDSDSEGAAADEITENIEDSENNE